MTNTIEIFEDRKSEIEFYYSVIVDYEEKGKVVINTIDNTKFFRIMKSNFILMLYNLVESSISNGLEEIYENVKSDNCKYEDLVEEIQNIWRDFKISEIYKPESLLKTYTNKVKYIVDSITSGVPIVLHKGMYGINGNLNAKKIKEICYKHRIRCNVIDDKQILDNVRIKRNALAHGDDSFSKCARDLTVSDLENIKDTIIIFIKGILNGMQKYCDEKEYLKQNAV